MKLRFTTLLILFSPMVLFFSFSLSEVSAAPTVELQRPEGTTYSDWLPADGAKMTFTVLVKNLYDSTIGFSKWTVNLTFSQITNCPGIYMNYPRTDPKSEKDFRFYFTDQTELPDGLTWSEDSWNGTEVSDSVTVKFTSKSNFVTFSFTITVRCENGGAVGTLMVTLTSLDPSKPFSPSDSDDLPEDKNGNYIAYKQEDKGIAVVARQPLSSGLLSGMITKDTKLAENDYRKN
ncbi:hypothetical protein JT359_19820 [Candidatus Poribacteria bacterium]|nr:hypothetical protein [Candidatus Poribacteria bacterium]